MKKSKLTLDKVNVVKLNSTHSIIGGRSPQKFDGDTAGIGVPNSTHCPDEKEELIGTPLKVKLPRSD